MTLRKELLLMVGILCGSSTGNCKAGPNSSCRIAVKTFTGKKM